MLLLLLLLLLLLCVCIVLQTSPTLKSGRTFFGGCPARWCCRLKCSLVWTPSQAAVKACTSLAQICKRCVPVVCLLIVSLVSCAWFPP